MLQELMKLANRLDELGEYDLASEVDAMVREAMEQMKRDRES